MYLTVFCEVTHVSRGNSIKVLCKSICENKRWPAPEYVVLNKVMHDWLSCAYNVISHIIQNLCWQAIIRLLKRKDKLSLKKIIAFSICSIVRNESAFLFLTPKKV